MLYAYTLFFEVEQDALQLGDRIAHEWLMQESYDSCDEELGTITRLRDCS